MPALESCFTNRQVVLPVIHAEQEGQARANAELAVQAGADGVFLINHGVAVDELLDIYRSVRAAFPDLWVGVNLLGLTPREALRRIPSDIDGVWTDNAMIDERRDDQADAQGFVDARREVGWGGLYFGGVAFKYQRRIDNVGRAAAIAAEYVDVVTTSGPATNEPASPEKIRRMKEAIGEFPLAIASGIRPENVADYLGIADCFLVASGVSKSWTEFDEDRLRALVDTVRGRGGALT